MDSGRSGLGLHLPGFREEVPGPYGSRKEAGVELGRLLASRPRPEALVLGIPRGGVPVAAEVARALGAPLDVIVAKKVGAPGNPELALGAVTASGEGCLNADVVAAYEPGEDWLARATEHAVELAREKERKLRSGRPALSVRGRHVILVDDGLATGATARACIRALRAQRPAELVLAAPVGAPETCASLAREVDELVCPRRPAGFAAVGLHYRDFEQVTDEEARALLQEFASA